MTLVRAAAHVHSTWSYDGTWTPERIASVFGRMGCRVVLMSEHDRGYDAERWEAFRAGCEAASTRSVLLVPGMEYSDAANDVHVLVWGAREFLGEGVETLELLERARAAGATTVLAHPGRRDVWRRVDDRWLELLSGIELWNRKYDGWAPGEAARGLLERAPDLLTLVGLDFHQGRQLFPLTMDLDLPGAVTASAVEAALADRRAAPQLLGVPARHAVTPRGLAVTGAAERARRGTARAARRIGAIS